jgi:DNA-directed RNA polymerase subunit beta
MVDDKMHARSIGPYSLITQQPLGGKAQVDNVLERWRFGHLRLMEHQNTLRKSWQLKSDDVIGRAKTYEAIVKGESMPEPELPRSFNVCMMKVLD